jgi:hypothetical protein
MVIANPIYDVVFKRMMENERVAKFFIGTLLEQTIETIEVKPQEFTYSDEFAAMAVFRLDFISTIKTDTGEYKKVLIEIQKAKNLIDLMRFRNYLAEQYKKEDKVNNKNVVLPITTIYILGFNLPEISTPCIKVERNYKDLINKTTLLTKSDFIEKLTHDSCVVQVERITDRYFTKLDKLLSVFEQTNFVDDTRIIKEFMHNADLEEVKIMTDILHHSGTNPSEKKKIETEQEAWRTVDALTGGLRQKAEQLLKEVEEKSREVEEKNREVEEKSREVEEKSREVEEKNKQLEEKNKEVEAKRKEAEEKDRIIAELMKKLNQQK